MTITSEQIIAIASVLGALAVIYGVVSKPFKALEELKKSVDNLSESMDEYKEVQDMQGDMIYQLLDHVSTNNNTGGMREALDKYNAFYRH